MSDEELMRIAFADKRTVQEILRHIFELGENKGRTEAVKEFAEWLSNTEYIASKGHFILPLRDSFTVDDVVARWGKERQNG